MMHRFRSVRFASIVALLLALGTTACSRTWEGVKEDTGENLQKTGQSLEKAGEEVEKRAQ